VKFLLLGRDKRVAGACRMQRGAGLRGEERFIVGLREWAHKLQRRAQSPKPPSATVLCSASI
jgi:hypothetical protein